MFRPLLLILLVWAFAAPGVSHGKTAENHITVALFGASSMRTSYLPKGQQHHDLLKAALSKAAPEYTFEVLNWADDGEFIPRYLIKGRYDRHLKRGIRPDVAIIRFGVNDQKYCDPREFAGQLETFIDLLIEDFPGIAILLETGMYVDFPAHYHYDRESVLSAYWKAARAVAEKRGFPVVDFHAVSKKETLAGNWDLRIRLTDRKTEPYVFDNRLDAERGHNTVWFSDIHPNPEGARLAVETEVPVLLSWLKERKAATASRTFGQPRDYTALLDFPPERFTRKHRGNTPTDYLQDPVDP